MINIISKGYPYRPEKGCFGYSTIGIVKTNKSVLFDTGGYNMRSEIKKVLEDIDYVVISHLHFDHCSNLDLFIQNQTPIFLSKLEYENYEKNKEKDLDIFSYFGYIKGKLNLKLIDSNTLIADNIEVILTPGHTLGHISLKLHSSFEDEILTGDALKTFSDYNDISRYGNAEDKQCYIKTKKWIIQNFNKIYPGHDSPILNRRQTEKSEVYPL